MKRLRCIGLTGGIGSGKSTAASMFKALGVPVLDLDKVGHAVTVPGSAGLIQLVQAFSNRMLNADGSLNRRALAAHCFGDAARTAQLNSILHPLIWQQEEQWLARQQSDYALIEASVLLESGGASRMDQVVVVLADEELRLQRVLKRGRHDEAAFRSIVSRQCDDAMRCLQADYIINNNGDVMALRDKVRGVHAQLLEL